MRVIPGADAIRGQESFSCHVRVQRDSTFLEKDSPERKGDNYSSKALKFKTVYEVPASKSIWGLQTEANKANHRPDIRKAATASPSNS